MTSISFCKMSPFTQKMASASLSLILEAIAKRSKWTNEASNQDERRKRGRSWKTGEKGLIANYISAFVTLRLQSSWKNYCHFEDVALVIHFQQRQYCQHPEIHQVSNFYILKIAKNPKNKIIGNFEKDCLDLLRYLRSNHKEHCTCYANYLI